MEERMKKLRRRMKERTKRKIDRNEEKREADRNKKEEVKMILMLTWLGLKSQPGQRRKRKGNYEIAIGCIHKLFGCQERKEKKKKKRRKENKLGLGPIDFLTQGPMAHLLSTPKFPSPIRIGPLKNPKPN
jgi:hypothetical protein